MFELPKEIVISDTEKYKTFLTEFDYNIEFFAQLSELIFCNGTIISYITDKNIYHLDTSLLDTSVQTLKSIKLCCSIGSFADANTLIRKLRDDLLLYIFIIDIINNRKVINEKDLSDFIDENNKFKVEKFEQEFDKIRLNSILSDDEKAIAAWFSDKVNDLPKAIRMKLSFENYMKRLKQNTYIKEILFNYNLEDYWQKLRSRLNDYVHNNGIQFTNHNLIKANSKGLDIHLKNINTRVSYISTYFFVLLLMVDSKMICSTDLIDHLDAGLTPPEDCQYFIASFIQEFIDKSVIKLHPELKQYLKHNNNYGMRIE